MQSHAHRDEKANFQLKDKFDNTNSTGELEEQRVKASSNQEYTVCMPARGAGKESTFTNTARAEGLGFRIRHKHVHSVVIQALV